MARETKGERGQSREQSQSFRSAVDKIAATVESGRAGRLIGTGTYQRRAEAASREARQPPTTTPGEPGTPGGDPGGPGAPGGAALGSGGGGGGGRSIRTIKSEAGRGPARMLSGWLAGHHGPRRRPRLAAGGRGPAGQSPGRGPQFPPALPWRAGGPRGYGQQQRTYRAARHCTTALSLRSYATAGRVRCAVPYLTVRQLPWGRGLRCCCAATLLRSLHVRAGGRWPRRATRRTLRFAARCSLLGARRWAALARPPARPLARPCCCPCCC